MHQMTVTNLRSAYGGESQAHMRYKVWGAKAKEEGYPKVANLFEAISYAEQIHATNHFRTMGDVGGSFTVTSGAVFGLGTTSENLQGGIDGETFEIQEMYPVYKAAAKFQGESGAERSFDWALRTEKVHAGMFQKAKQAVDSGEDVQVESVQICEVCGYTVEGEAPDKCLVRGTSKGKFRRLSVK